MTDGRNVLALNGQTQPVSFEDAGHRTLLYVRSHLFMSTIWDAIPYQYLSHNSWPLGFLTLHLVPINIYFLLLIFAKALTTEKTKLQLNKNVRVCLCHVF
jgi:hypothetical protein